MSILRSTARRLGLGALALYGYHKPVNYTRALVREGGPIERRKTRQGQRAMEEAAPHLPPMTPPAGPILSEITYLTGARFWYQTLFCFAALQHHVPQRLDPVIYDDGSLTQPLRDQMRRVIPWIRFVEVAEVQERIEAVLPASQAPSLRARHAVFPLFRKLLDFHVGASGRVVVVDSDILTFRRPDLLIDLLADPEALFYMTETPDAYGYSPALLGDLARGPLPKGMNAGLYGLNSPAVDWAYMEACCARMLAEEGPHYFQEQALTALLFAEQTATPLPMEAYLVLPNLAEGQAPRAVVHHYVSHSKRSYFQHGWQRVFKALERAAYEV